MNQDHIEASKLCLTAARHCKTILTYQSNLFVLNEPFSPTLFFDISGEIEQKVEALKCYSDDHNRFGSLFESNIKRNAIWGFSNKVEYAEGFQVIKILVEDNHNG